MSIPSQLANKIKSIPMDPLALANNIELAYMQSFSTYNLSNDSAHCSTKDTYNSALFDYNFVDFDEHTYDALFAETSKNYQSKNATVVRSIRNSFKQFYTRVAAMTYSTVLKKNQLFEGSTVQNLKVPSFQAQYKIDQLRGNNPSDWPRNLKQFHQQISKLPWNAFACEPTLYFEDFIANAFNTIRNFMLKLNQKTQERGQIVKDIELIIQIIVMISLKTNNQTFILTQLEYLNCLNLQSFFSDKQMSDVVNSLMKFCNDIFDKIPINEEQEYHMPKKLWQKGSAFMIMKKIHFQRQNGLSFFSVTNDGTYLYVYISSINGGMYKIGTGKNSSTPGKIYLQKQILLPVGSKLEEVNWIYLKGKLYLKTTAREPNCLEVINPNTFKTQQVIQLKSRSLFGHQSLINLNRNSIILTDGQKIYFLGKQIKITKGKQEKKEEQVKTPKEQEDLKGKRKKIKKQKNQQNPTQNQQPNPEQVDKIVQFVLYEFEFEQKDMKYQCDEILAQQLYLSFNNYFSIQQCRKALDLSENDLSQAAQWLVDQGEKQRTTKILYPVSKVVIAQSQITNNFNEKAIKGTSEVLTKQNSLLHCQNIHQSIWTMDEQQITCFSQAGIKIFSKSSSDSHEIVGTSALTTTHLKTVQGKFQRNPEYTISYDPINRNFYTFTWPTDGGHYFPTAVLIGSDHKHAAELTVQKKFSVSQLQPKNMRQFSQWTLIQMNLIDNGHCAEQGRANNWNWYFAQKIIEINKQLSANNQSNTKKLTNKRSKLLAKMNKINQYYRIYQKQKEQFEKTGKVRSEVIIIPPFGCDGSIENLEKIRNIFGKNLQPEKAYMFIFALEGWLQNCLNLPNPKVHEHLYKIKSQLIELRKDLNITTSKKVTSLFINNFYEFFESVPEQQKFIASLEKDEIIAFIEKHHHLKSKSRKSIVYDIKDKENIIPKFESKTKFEQIFPTASNVLPEQITSLKNIQNLLSSSADPQSEKCKVVLLKSLQKQLLTNANGIKLFQYIFQQAFRTVILNKKYNDDTKSLKTLFLDAFKLFEAVTAQANTSQIANLCDIISQIIQLYFASLCSFEPCEQVIELLLKILQNLQKKQILPLLNFIQEMELEGISQTFQKVYETPHPIERGKNQSFPSLKLPQASLIYAEFDKRCQSDPNHDILSIQMIHENMPVGNSINCNDGIFTTNLRLTGKVDSGKPYLIIGNSINIDFTSSGHAKDSKSFGRFGFKFGLRPIYAGKIKYKKGAIQKIQKLFGTKSQFQKYLNTLKFIVVSASTTIQNLNYLEKAEQHNKLVKRYLNGKIFKQGYEQQLNLSKIDFDKKYGTIYQEHNQNTSKNHDGRLWLLKLLHSDCLKNAAKLNNLKSMPQNLQDNVQIWDLQGIPTYIKAYVQKIKSFNGDFIDVFREARQLAPPKGIYATELKKSGFNEQMKRLWLQGEAILFLTVLKHSGLLHLNLKFSIEYIKANLKAFQQARNGIFESFIRRMQTVRQWRDLLQNYSHKKQVKQQEEKKIPQQTKQQKLGNKSGIQIKKKGMATKTIKFDANKGVKKLQKTQKKIEKKEEQNVVKQVQRKKQIQKSIRQRLTEDYMIKSICHIKNIQYTDKQTFQNVTRIINRLEQQSKSLNINTQSVYIQPIQHLIKSCLFLLKLKSSSSKQIMNKQDDLVPQQIFRSYSQDPRHQNLNKVKIFRQWLQNWKKWKDFKKQGKIQLKFPVSQIIEFVNSWIPLNKFKEQIELRVRLASNRTKFYQFNTSLLKNTSNSFLSKYIVGAQAASLKGGYNSGLESVSSVKLSELASKYKQYTTALILEEQKKFNQLPLKLSEIQQLIKTESDGLLDKIKLTALHLYLIQSENPQLKLQIALFFISLKYVSATFQELIFISSLIVQKAFISNYNVQNLLSVLWRQIGNNTISCKRWKDYFFIERTLFILRKLQHKCRQKLQLKEKQKIAQILFYIIYHLDVPIICRVCLRLLNLLKISFNNDIETPFTKSYKIITFDQKQWKTRQFKLQNYPEYKNAEIIATKSFNILRGEQNNKIKQALLLPFKQLQAEDPQKKQDTYNLILNMNMEEDIVWLVTILYYIEEIQNTITPIKDWADYLAKKNKKKEHHKQKDKQANSVSVQVNIAIDKKVKRLPQQRILLNIPNQIITLSQSIENELPVGWFFNYCNVYNEFNTRSITSQNNFAPLPIQNVPNLSQKKNKNNGQAVNPVGAKKQWNPTEFMKLYKKFEDLTSKPIEQPKQQQSQQIKNEFVKAKNFVSRIRRHCAQISIIFYNFSQNGYYLFREDLSKEKCQLICQLFSLGSENRLKPIPCDFKTKDYATKLSPSYIFPLKKSQLKITCIRTDQYRKFNELFNAPSSIPIKVENNPLLYYANLGVNEFVLEDKCHLPYDQFPEIQDVQDDTKLQFSKYFMESSISRMKKRQDEVYLKEYQNLRYFIAQGGLESGLETCTLVPTFDSSVTCQKSKIENVYPAKAKRQFLSDPEQLLEKAIKVMKGQFKQISSKEHIFPYILITCILEKLSGIDMSFLDMKLVKEFAEQLLKFSKGFKAGSSTESYKQKVQILITKMLDSDNQNLSRFRLYRFEEDKISEEIIKYIDDKLKSSLKQQKIASSTETIQSHQYLKSNYLLPVHPPLAEQNNLLMYWQKNILPKIHEFVKSSLKQIQIDDFFEQMRIPLRNNDQLEAKKIAYVICDNKLPQGAVLPDANHNWNSLTVQDVAVGQDVLIKLSKSKYDSPTPLLCGQAQQFRVGQIMFIDQKNLSALVRHRLSQYALFTYSWVPINSLQTVEQSLAHYSIETIFKSLEDSFKGLVKNYAQICLTQLSTKIKLNMEELIGDTIIDLLRDNPIYGWDEGKEWSLRPALKNLLKQGNTRVAQMIQQKFCPIQSYDIDLFNQNMLKLNKFDNILGLIVQFKKTSTLIWYSAIKFYSDSYGYNEIAKTYASRSCINQLQPLQFRTPNIFSKYESNKSSLKPYEQTKYEQKQLFATVFGVNPAWTISTYLSNVVGEIAVEQNKYQEILTRINRVFLSWLQKKQVVYLSTELCRVITINTLRIKKLLLQKEKQITLQNLGSTEAQLKSFIQWINALISQQQKDMIILYSPLLQNLMQLVASLLSGLQKVSVALPSHVQQMIKMIQMTTQIQRSLLGKKIKKTISNNDTQWERILLIQNIPTFISEKELRQRLKSILVKNNAKVLAPSYDIFYSKGKAVILVDSWDITELVEEEVIEKLQNQEEKEPQPEGQQGLLMQWSCQVCTFINPVGNTHCQACQSPAPAPKVEIVYEKVETKDVNETEKKLKQKEKSRFQNVKQEILTYFEQAWKAECVEVDKNKQAQQKNREERRKKKGKNIEQEQKVLQKPQKPNIHLSSGSQVLDKNVVQQFLKLRFNNLPQAITKKISEQASLYLNKFKQLSKLGFDLWGDNITNETPALLSLQLLTDLMNYVQDEICKGSSSVLSYSQSSIRLINQIPLLNNPKQILQEPLNFTAENNVGVKIKYKKLAQQKSYNIRYSWKIIKDLNLSASKCLSIINMELSKNSNARKICLTNSVGANLKCLRQLVMGALKLQLFKKIMQKTSVALEPQDIPKIALERLKIKEESLIKKVLISAKDKDDFLFTKAHQQLQKISSINLRPFKPKGTQPYLSFGVHFKGEMVQGQAGPYRQFFTDMSTELHPQTGLNLFIKTPNNVHKTGEGRQKWTINPKAKSTYYLSLFHFLGRLMGCCIRTGCHMTIDLANFCWKLIADQKVKKIDIDELDRKFYEQNQQLIDCPSEETFDYMEQAVGEPVTWIYTTVDGEEQELIPNGRNERVSYEKRIQYVKMMEKSRIQEVRLQINKIKQGLSQLIPEPFLNHISGQELKIMVCGVPKVDVQLLRKHTKYAGGLNQESGIIKYFWQMMKEIKEEQRLKIIRFCWGQQRLPLNSEQFERNGIRFMIKPMLNKQNPDQALPKADTCFFNIQLPQYSNKDIMKERILLAVNLDSTSINADRNMMTDDNPLMGNVDYEDEAGEDDGEGGG